MSSDLQGRNAVVFGVANKRSIAWSIAQGLHAAGMKLAITYQNERLEQEAKDLILSLPGAEAYMCDVSKDEEIDRLFATLKERQGKLHTLVHSVAYAPADELKGEFINTTREGFRIALDVSVYSLVAVARAAAPLMEDGGSIITMTYYASEKVVPRYNVMAVAKAGLECSGKRHLRRTGENPGRARHLRLRRHAQSPRRTRPARPQCRYCRSRLNRSLPRLQRQQWHHRRSHLRRLRIQHHGVLEGHRSWVALLGA
jgi:enoyl-[acyl-carrier protein] reductase I